MEAFFRFLINKGIIYIYEMENSFYIYKYLDKNIAINNEIIELNYASESPFRTKSLLFTSITEGKHLYVWFHNVVEKKRYVPVSLLLFRKLLSKKQSGIYIFKGQVNRIIIIKDNVLVATFIKKDLTNHNLILMKEEYSLTSINYILEEEYASFLENSYKHLKYSDLFSIFDFQIKFKDIFEKVIRWCSLPLLISTCILVLIVGSYNFYIEDINKNLLISYKKEANSRSNLKDQVSKNEELNLAFLSLSEEFKYIDKTIALSTILKITEEMNLTIKYIRLNNMNIDFKVESKEDNIIPIYSRKLFKSDLFIDVKNVSSHRIQNIKTQALMQVQLKGK